METNEPGILLMLFDINRINFNFSCPSTTSLLLCPSTTSLLLCPSITSLLLLQARGVGAAQHVFWRPVSANHHLGHAQSSRQHHQHPQRL